MLQRYLHLVDYILFTQHYVFVTLERNDLSWRGLTAHCIYMYIAFYYLGVDSLLRSCHHFVTLGVLEALSKALDSISLLVLR